MGIQLARRLAEGLTEKFHQHQPPVAVDRIARELGLRIVHEKLDDGVSGLLISRNGSAIICVHKKDSPERQRFTIGHEVGHFVLRHQFDAGEHVHVDRGNYISQRGPRASEGIDPKEIEANQFAASLLMPERMIQKELQKLPRPLMDQHVQQLAEKFEVSEQAMTIRLASLGFV